MLDRIRIGWKDYEIRLTESAKTLMTDGTECYGYIDHNDAFIELNKNFSDDQIKATLIHEVLHGISDMISLDLSEDTVTRLANAIYSTLKQNNINLVKGSE